MREIKRGQKDHEKLVELWKSLKNHVQEVEYDSKDWSNLSEWKSEHVYDIINNNKGIVFQRNEGGLYSHPDHYNSFYVYGKEDLKEFTPDNIDHIKTCSWFKSKSMSVYEFNGKKYALLEIIDWY